tara:strand:+ start:26525 stop:34975 length:8451 start_codon:yes stop_codon:yes gene_type:complete
MATRFLVPRANAEGGIGTSTKKWNEANFVTGNFTTLKIGATPVEITSTAAELNILDGVTASTAELNYLDITTLGTSQASKALTADASGDVKLAGHLQLNVQKELRFADNDSSHHVGFKSPATVSSNTVYTLPDAYPDANGKVLSSTTAGVLSWAANAGGGGNAFTTFAVSGQSDVVADSSTDTLTLVAGSNVTITTNASSDTITIAASGGGGSGDIEGVTAGDGLSGGGTTGTVSLALDLNELTAAAVDVANDSIAIIDATDNSSKKESIADLVTAVKGNGLTATNGVLAVNTNSNNIIIQSNQLQLPDMSSGNSGLSGGQGGIVKVDLDNLPTTSTVNVASDSFAFIDSDGSQDTFKESISDLITAVAGDGLAASSGVLSVGVDDSSIETNSDALRVKASGVTNAMLAGSIADSKLNQITTADKVAGSAVQLASTSALENSTGLKLKAATAGDGLAISNQVLSVGVDDSSIEINSDALRVKASGVTNAMLAGSIADSKLNTISTAGKVALTALEIDGGTDIGADLADADLLIVDDGAGGTNRKAALSRVKSYIETNASITSVTDTIAVTVVNSGGNKYALDGVTQKVGVLSKGFKYKFDQSDASNSGHPLRFSTTSDGTHNSGSAYSTNVTVAGTPGNSGAYTLIDLTQATPETLYYYCTAHSGMGASVQSEGVIAGSGLSKSGMTLSVGTISDANKVSLSALDIDGGTDIGADLVDADLIVVDDGAGGTNRKSALSRVPTYVFSKVSGDATIAAGGALTLAADSVEGSMLNDNVISEQTEMTGDVVDTDELLISDAGTIKRADFSVVRDAVFSDVSGNATIAAGGALTIAATSVEGSMLNNNVISGQTELAAGLASTDELIVSDAGSLKRMDVSVLQSYMQSNLTFTSLTQENVEDYVGGMVDSNTETFITVTYDDSDGTLDFIVPVHDEDDMNSNSATHLATQQSIKAYVDAQVAGGGLNIDGYSALGSTAVHQTEDHFVFSDNGTEKKITFSNLQDAIFSDVSGDATIAAGGALTIAATSVENSMLAGSIANAKLANSTVQIGSTSTALGATSASLAGLESIAIDNITIDGNTISSTDSNGHIILDPNGSGEVQIASPSKITGVATPTSDSDAANKAYVDSVAEGLDVKDSVHVASTANIASLADGCDAGATIDGVVLVAGDRVLLKDQSTASENGIYVVGNDGVAPSRAADMAASSNAAGVFVFVEEGTTNADSGFVCTSNADSDTVGTHSLTFTQFSGAGQVTAGSALTKSGNTLNVAVDDSSIEVSSDALRVKAGGITNAMLADDAVGADELAANAVVNASITDGTIKADKFDIDGSTDIGADLVDADLIVVDDGASGANRKSTLTRVKKYIYSAMSGDATASDSGALTIAANAVEGSMINSNAAGDGLSYSSNALNIDLNELTAAAVDVANDSIAIVDANDSNGSKKESIVDLMTAVAGNGIAASSGVLALDINGISSSLDTTPASGDLLAIYDADAGTLKKITRANLTAGLGSGSTAADDISSGNDVVNLTTSSGNVNITADATNAAVVVKGDHESGVAIHLDGNANAASIVDIDAGVLDIDATAGITIDGTTVSIDGTDDSNLTVTGSGKDLDIAVAGGGTQELRLASAGTGASALHLNASAGGINIDSADMIDIDAADEITIDTTSADGHIAITSAHTAGQAILISANADAGAILDVDAGIVDVDVQGTYSLDATGISLDSDAASNFTTSSGALTLDGAGGVSIAGNSSEVDITTSGALDLNVGSVDLDSTAGITIDGSTVSIDGTAASNLTMTANDSSDITLTIAASNSGSGAGVIDMDADGAITVDAGAGLSLDAGAASNFTTSAGLLTLDGAGGVSIAGNSSEVDITTTGALDLNSGAFTLDGSTLSIDGTDDSNLTLTANSSSAKTLTIAASNSGSGAGAIDIDSDGAITVDAGSGLSLDSADDSNLTMTANSSSHKTLTIASANSGSGKGKIDIDASGDITIDTSAGGISLDSTDTTNLTMTAASSHAATKTLTISATNAHSSYNSNIAITADGNVDIDASDNVTIDAADDISLTSTSSNGLITLHSAHTAGQAILIDANAAAGSILDVDAGILDVDVQGATTINAGGAITLTGAGVNLAGGSSEVDITTSGALDLNVGSVDLDSSAGIAIDGTTLSLDGTDTSNFTMTANSSSDKTLTIAASNSGSGSGIISLSADSLSLTGAAAFGSAATFNAGLLTKAGSSAGFVRFYEQSGNGSNYIGLVAPNAVSSDVSFTLPSADGSDGQVLKTNGSGVLSFVDQSGGGLTAADDIGPGDGAVNITTSSGDITLNANHSGGNILFKSNSTEFLKVDLSGNTKFGGGAGSTGVTITSLGQITADGRVIIDNATNATSTTDGSLQTDGGLSVAKDTVIGDDLFLKSDAAVIHFGADSDITLTHVADTGLTLEAGGVSAVPVLEIKNTNNDANGSTLKFTKDGNSPDDSDVIGNILFASENDAPEAKNYSKIISQISDASDGTQNAGKFTVQVLAYEQETDGLILEGTTSGSDTTINATIGYGYNSTVTVPGTLSMSNASNSTIKQESTAHNQNGKSLTIAAGSTTAGTTDNKTGGSLTLKGGQGKGSGAGGDIIFQVANAGSSGSSLNSYSTALTISDDKSATFTGEVVISAGNLDIGGTNVTSTAAELNLLDGATSATSTTLVDADRIIVNDDGTMKQVALSDLKTYTGSGSGSASKPGYNAETITSAKTIDPADWSAGDLEEIYIFTNNQSSALAVNLPATNHASVGAGFKLNIKTIGSAGLTITATSNNVIDGSGTFSMSTQYEAITLVSNGGSGSSGYWYII